MPEALLLAGLDRAPDAILGADKDGRVLYANLAACELLGYPRTEFMGISLRALGLKGTWDDGKASPHETRLLTRAGQRVPVEITLSRVLQEARDVTFLYIHDITARRAAESALRKSESRYALAFNASPDAINITRLDTGAYMEVSKGFERLTGWTREEVHGRSSLELGIWDDAEDRQKLVAILKAKGEFDSFPVTFRGKTGSIIKGLMSGRLVSLDDVPCLLSVTRDITLQVEAQQALGNLSELISAITENVPAFIFLLDPACRILFVNRLPSGIAKSDVIGKDFGGWMMEKAKGRVVEAVTRILGGSDQETVEGWGLGSSQEPRWYRCTLGPMRENGRVVGAVLIAMDTTQNREMEAALRQAQKLESLGVLAGGIAHDFNNLLTAIMGNLNLAQLKLPETSPAFPHLEAVENTVLKASDLTRQMLAYSGKGRFSVKPLDLNTVVAGMAHLLEMTVSRNARLTFNPGGELPGIEGDAAQIQQVVMNLVANASEALGDRKGTIHVSTALENLDADRIDTDFPAQALTPGPFLVLTVVDDGCGMAPEVLSRIFDPFFTTKVKGRGLGLSALLGILKGHKAGIRIQSAQGAGSRFQIYFPASPKVIAQPKQPHGVSTGAFNGTVLLVDDEIVILESITLALESFGFTVVQAKDGVEAVERFEALGPKLKLVLMDLTMPRMDGATAFGIMQASRPEIPVVLSSGYDRQALEGVQPAAFVQKPYRLKELSRLLQEVLAR